MPRWRHIPNELQLQLQLQLQRFVYGTDILGIESNRPTRGLETRTSRYCSVARSKTKQGLTLINDTDMIIRLRQLVIVWKSGGRAGFKPQAGASSLLARLKAIKICRMKNGSNLEEKLLLDVQLKGRLNPPKRLKPGLSKAELTTVQDTRCISAMKVICLPDSHAWDSNAGPR